MESGEGKNNKGRKEKVVTDKARIEKRKKAKVKVIMMRDKQYKVAP